MQLNLFAEDNRLEKLTKLGDSLLKLNVVNWESFRPALEKVFNKERKSNAGRHAFDVVMMFKTLVFQRLFNLSDNHTEHRIDDCMRFMRFLGLSLVDRVPDTKTIWLFRENLTKAGVMEQFFINYCKELEKNGIITHSGTIIDAIFVDKLRQKNTREKKRQSNPEMYQKSGQKILQKQSISWRRRIQTHAGQRKTTNSL